MAVNQNASGASIRRRNRPTVVCTNCKRRKSKCDRQQPCSNCIRFGNTDTCLYVINPKNAKLRQSDGTDGNVRKIRHISKGDSNTDNSDAHEISSIPTDFHTSSKPFALNETKYVNLSPNGSYIQIKRSAITMFSCFTNKSIECRDLYLSALVMFRSIAIDMNANALKEHRNYSKNPSLPHSFKHLSIFDADGDPLSSDNLFRHHKLIHRSLFDKYGKYRKDASTKIFDANELLNGSLPSRNLFFDHILKFFESHIVHMIPIFDLEGLKYDANNFYSEWEHYKMVSVKNFDHMVCCVILLITKLCILSMNFSNLPSELHGHLKKLDTSKYIAITHHYIFEMKSLRKCTLRQLQVLILLRFYYWCAPEDGDGDSLQQSQILMGTIIASCKEMGVSWLSIRDPNLFLFEVFAISKQKPFMLSPGDLKNIYQMIWSHVLYWDRKLFLTNGQECLITKTYPYEITNREFSWHQRMLAIDQTLMNMNNLLNDLPSKVDVAALKKEWGHAYKAFQQIRDDKKEHLHLNFEYETMLELFMLCLSHAELIHLEQSNDVASFHFVTQSLWDQVVRLATKCHRYFYGTQEMDPYSRFFTNKIVSVVSDKLCTLIPLFVLRVDSFGAIGFDQRNIMIKFLFGICSMYYNELGFDYYRCFEGMFAAKITYKILNRPPNKNPWRIILEFLLCQLEKGNTNGNWRELEIIQGLPSLLNLRDSLKRIPIQYRDSLKSWNTDIIPITQANANFTLDLRENLLQPVLFDRYSQNFNIFASFYDHASSKLAKDAENTSVKKELDNQNFRTQSQEVAETEENPIGDSLLLETPANTLDLDQYNLELIQDIFEPLDFISFF